MALSKDRNTPVRTGQLFSGPVKADTTIYAGALVCRDASGWMVPGSTATGLKPVGRANAIADNAGGSNGDITVDVERGVFRWNNSADSDEIAKADIGNICYVVDDETVAKTSATGTRSRAGTIVDVDAQGVWVLVGYGLQDAPGGSLVAANNLSDVGAAATARANIGANKHQLAVRVEGLDGTTPAYLVAPVAGTITKLRSVVDGALATGNATITAAIAGTPVTNGVITIAESGSAAGVIDEATPSGANTVTAGQLISLTPGGTNSAEVGALVIVEITF